MALPKRERLSPTGVVGCRRGTFMDRLGYRAPLDPKTAKIFKQGHMIHRMLQKSMGDRGLLYYPEGGVYIEDPPIHGKVDGLLPGPVPVPVDFKTTGKHPNDITGPAEDHIGQVTLYSGALEVPYSLLAYYSKVPKRELDGVPRLKLFLVPHDPDLYDQLLARAFFLLKCLREGYLPEKDCWRCRNPACYDKRIHRQEGLRSDF